MAINRSIAGSGRLPHDRRIIRGVKPYGTHCLDPSSTGPPVQKNLDHSPTDPTLDQPTAIKFPGNANPCKNVALVEGSGPHISLETAQLLRVRLRAAALSLFAAFAVFFIWRLIKTFEGTATSRLETGSQFAVLVILGICWLALRRKCIICLRSLQFYEILIFVSPALFFLLLEHDRMLASASRNFLQNPVARLVCADLHLRDVYPQHLALRCGDHQLHGRCAVGIDRLSCISTPAVLAIASGQSWLPHRSDANARAGGADQRLWHAHGRHIATRGLRSPAAGPVSSAAD